MKTRIADISDLTGETIAEIDIVGGDRVLITTASGRSFVFEHDQDCCEHVDLVDVEGDVTALLGKVVRYADKHEDINDEPRPENAGETWTKTTITLKCDNATLVTKWIGTSNGYYSERVDIKEIFATQNTAKE